MMMLNNNSKSWGILLIWILVGQGTTVLSIGAGGKTTGAGLDIFSLLHYFSFSFSFSLGDNPIKTEILSQRAVKHKTTKQHTSQ